MNMKKCNHCGTEKVFSAFTRNNLCVDGYLNICKECYNLRAKKYREKKERQPPTDFSGLKLTNTTKEDWCKAFEFLERIGYDLTKDVHQQFCDKHLLTPRKKKPSENVISYIPSDCRERWKLSSEGK